MKKRKRREGKLEEYMGEKVLGEVRDGLFWGWFGRI
jgi:hypothetical protein